MRLSYFLWSSMPDDELLDLGCNEVGIVRGWSLDGIGQAGSGKSFRAQERSHFKGIIETTCSMANLLTILDGPDANSHWVGLIFGEVERPIRRDPLCRDESGYEFAWSAANFQAASKSSPTSVIDVVELLEVKEAPPRGWVTDRSRTATSRPASCAICRRRILSAISPKWKFAALAGGTVLDQQDRRMLADRRAKSLTDNFAMHWLQINKLPTARPSTEFFPEFNANVRQAMFDETSQFFDALRREDRSLLELLDADYTFVTRRTWPGITGSPGCVRGKELRKVTVRGLTREPSRRSAGNGKRPVADVTYIANQPDVKRQMDS